jgi:hypothetical protein
MPINSHERCKDMKQQAIEIEHHEISRCVLEMLFGVSKLKLQVDKDIVVRIMCERRRDTAAFVFEKIVVLRLTC